MLRVGIVTGEASGDYLAAELVRALHRKLDGVVVEGVGGDRLREAGCRILYPRDRLSVMGLVEVLGSCAALVRLRRRLLRHFLDSPPDIFIGVDAPDFNLGLERQLRRRGVRTVHYVSPSVWAWRRYRLRGIASAVDLMLVLFPFEAAFYRESGIPVCFTGHPLADLIPLQVDQRAARRDLGLPEASPLVALMPGSRRMELNNLLEPMLLAAQWCRDKRGDLGFLCNTLSEDASQAVRRAQAKLGLQDLPLRVFQGRSREVLAAADVALLASGTVTLEAMLLQKPMVVTYRVNPLTYQVLRRLAHVGQVALPNILAGEMIVPELLQDDCRPDKLGPAVLDWLDNPEKAAALRERCRGLHAGLRRNAGDTAAAAIISHLDI